MVRIDASIGDGGGHSVRAALGLAAACRTEVEIVNVCATHRVPGLHGSTLAVARAVAEVTHGRIEGGPGADVVRFFPGKAEPGRYELGGRDGVHAVSAPLVVQAVAPALALAGGRSELVVRGATHGGEGPTATYLQTVFAPTARKLGMRIETATPKWGWGLDGVGELRARVESAEVLRGADITERGEMLQIGGSAVSSGLEHGAAERQQNRVNRRLREVGRSASVQVVDVATDSVGGMVYLIAVCERSLAGFTALWREGVAAEQLSDEAVDELFAYITSYMVLDKHVADQVLTLAAIAEGETRFSTAALTPHTLATAEMARRIAGATVHVDGRPGGPAEIEVVGGGVRR